MEDELRETHFAALVIGTGLSQSIVAAALSAASQPIIHIDEHAAYGGPHASLSLNELSEWAGTRAEHVRIDESLVSRQYALSLAPQLVPATGPFVAALVNSGVARYGSFVMPKRVVVATPAATNELSGAPSDQPGAGNAAEFLFRTVPSNKQDVFRDKSVSLVQKRRLIKFLVFASGEFEGSTELQGKEDIPLLDFAQSVFGLERDLAEALAYAVAFCTLPNDATLPALIRTRTYLRSVGRYGPSPFLIGHYGGAGELAQGFCRTCAVGGGTYVLGRKVVSIVRADGASAGEEGEENGVGKEQTHRERTTASGTTVQTYHPPATFEGYGVEGVNLPPPQLSEQDPASTTDPAPISTAEPNPASTAEPEPASTDPLSPPTPQGPLFRIQLEGFAAPFTASTLIGPESWLAQILDNAPPKDHPTHTVRAIIVIDAPESFAFESSGTESEEKVGLDESVLVFPPKVGGGGGQSAVMGLVNGSNTMSCPDGKCILYLSAQTPSLDESPKAYLEPYVNAVLDGCTPRPTVWAEAFWREEEVERVAVRKASTSTQPEQPERGEYSTMHFTEGPDAAAREAERVFWNVLGTKPGEDGKGEGGVEFFARVGREEDLDDF